MLYFSATFIMTDLNKAAFFLDVFESCHTVVRLGLRQSGLWHHKSVHSEPCVLPHGSHRNRLDMISYHTSAPRHLEITKSCKTTSGNNSVLAYFATTDFWVFLLYITRHMGVWTASEHMIWQHFNQSQQRRKWKYTLHTNTKNVLKNEMKKRPLKAKQQHHEKVLLLALRGSTQPWNRK